MGRSTRIAAWGMVGIAISIAAYEHPRVSSMAQDISTNQHSPQGIKVELRKKEDRLEKQTFPVIRSASGIGGATITPVAVEGHEKWPEVLRIQLMLQGLEHLELRFDKVPILIASIPSGAEDRSSGRSPPSSSVDPAAAVDPADPEPTRKLPVRIDWKKPLVRGEGDCEKDQLRGFEILPVLLGADRKRVGFEIRIPRTGLEQVKSIELEWIDFYR